MKIDAGIKLPKWTNRIELSDTDYENVMQLIGRWNDEFDFIEKYKNDPFIIYGHVKAQEDIYKEVMTIYKKYNNEIN